MLARWCGIPPQRIALACSGDGSNLNMVSESASNVIEEAEYVLGGLDDLAELLQQRYY